MCLFYIFKSKEGGNEMNVWVSKAEKRVKKGDPESG